MGGGEFGREGFFWIVVGKHDVMVGWTVGEYSGLVILWIHL